MSLRTHRHARLHRALPLALTLPILSCDVDLLADASFDVWCGDTLCSWVVEQGEIARVPTWHAGDAGVSLIGEDVLLSQRSDTSHAETACIRFDLLATVARGVSLTLEMDFLDDGTVEYTAPLASDDYQPATYTVTPPVWFDGLRIRVRKTGSGQATIGQIRARAVDAAACPDPPLSLARPLGAPCTQPQDCQDGACPTVSMLYSEAPFDASVCSTCTTPQDCSSTTTTTCGSTFPDADETIAGFAYLTCQPPGQGALGDLCQDAGECAGGRPCVDHQCAECDPTLTLDCAPHTTSALAPHQLQPGRSLRAPGEDCLRPQDCQSGTCLGEPLRLCSPDGRRCLSDDDCPQIYITPTCETIGVDRGTCQ